MKRVARPERFELPTLWFEGVGGNSKSCLCRRVRAAALLHAFQLCSKKSCFLSVLVETQFRYLSCCGIYFLHRLAPWPTPVVPAPEGSVAHKLCTTLRMSGSRIVLIDEILLLTAVQSSRGVWTPNCASSRRSSQGCPSQATLFESACSDLGRAQLP
jgi:hypothetical protein